MKTIAIKNILRALTASLILTVVLTACEQEGVAPELATAPGGGTATTFKAYTLDSIPGKGEVYGRVVFWKDNAENTLVQISLYNTNEDVAYPTAIYAGTAAGGSTTTLTSLSAVDGSKGEFSPYKYFVIGNKAFFDALDDYDAHVTIMAGTTPIALGDIGKNADPVQEGE